MGIKGLAGLLKSHCGGKKSLAKLSHPNTSTNVIAVDMNVIMIQALKSPRAADEFHQQPPYPPLSCANSCLNYVRRINKIDNTRALPVFDGDTSTVWKAAVAGPTRTHAHKKALNKLRNCLKKESPIDHIARTELLKDINKHRKGSVKVTASVRAQVMTAFDENDIDYLVAPYEADWQIAYLHSEGLVHGIITTDSDYWALIDDPCVIYNLSVATKEAHVCLGDGHPFCGGGRAYQLLLRLRESTI